MRTWRGRSSRQDTLHDPSRWCLGKSIPAHRALVQSIQSGNMYLLDIRGLGRLSSIGRRRSRQGIAVVSTCAALDKRSQEDSQKELTTLADRTDQLDTTCTAKRLGSVRRFHLHMVRTRSSPSTDSSRQRRRRWRHSWLVDSKSRLGMSLQSTCCCWDRTNRTYTARAPQAQLLDTGNLVHMVWVR